MSSEHREPDDGYCPTSPDATHCECWWEGVGKKCCTCGHDVAAESAEVASAG